MGMCRCSFVNDVIPYENMKLRMLNGAHSMLAYSGQLSGKTLSAMLWRTPITPRLSAATSLQRPQL